MANQNQKADPAHEAEELVSPEVGDAVQFFSAEIAELYAGDGIGGMKDGPYAAIITRVRHNARGDVKSCDLTVFMPNSDPRFEADVPMAGAENDTRGRNWNWPAR